eukprot:Skav207591  [mRNA]  locus=scaffold2450:68164:68382:- [translate_table: standard]
MHDVVVSSAVEKIVALAWRAEKILSDRPCRNSAKRTMLNSGPAPLIFQKFFISSLPKIGYSKEHLSTGVPGP